MPQVVGLDIGPRCIHAALFERGFRGLELSAIHRVDFDPADAEGVARALAEIASRLQGGFPSVVARLPGDRVLLRFLEMPISDPKKLEQIIPFEVESQVPYELDELVVDHCIVSRKPDGGARVLVAAARREDVRLWLETMTAAGLEPRFLGAGAASLSTLAMAVPSLAKGTVALIDAGAIRTDVCVLSEGSVAWARTLSGSAESIETLVAEIRRTLLAAEIEGGVVASRVVLFGELAGERGFPALVEQASGVLVEPLSFANEEWGRAFKPAAGNAGAASEAGTAVALAFRSLAEGGAGQVNFRRGELAFKRDVRELSGILTRAVVAACLLAFLALFHYAVVDLLRVREKKQLDKSIADQVLAVFPDAPKDRLRDGDAAVSIMKGNVEDAQARLAQLGGPGVPAVEVLRALSDAIPPGMYIDVKDFDLADSKVRMKCTLDSFEASDRLVAALKKVKIFANVEDPKEGGNDVSGKRRVTMVFDVVAPPEGGI